MPSENLFAACASLPSPVLTVYVNTVPQDAARHPRVRLELAWLLDMAEALRQELSHRDAKQFERQVRRVRRFLEQRHPAERAVVIFAGARNWQVIPLHVPLRNKLYWGIPRIDPLLPLLHAHLRYGFAVMDHMAVRYFELANSDMRLLGGKQFEIDASQWKRKDQGRVTNERVQKSRGPLRDLYERRIEAQYKRLCHQVAGEITAIAKKNEFDGLFLVGPDRLIQAVREKIPHPLADSTVVVQENLGRSSPRELQRRLQPLVDYYEQEQQLSNVRLLQASERAAVTNPDEVLAQVQHGRIRTLLVARDLELALRQCPKCGLASRAADRVCANCGDARQEITLGELLTQVLATGNVKIKFVSGDAAQLLLRTGGLGGWLRAARVAAAS
jgi:peptide subunit release factor 1 (eRF1)